MKKLLFSILMIVAINGIVWAQGDTGDDPDFPDVPLDGGLAVLAIAGGLAAGRKVIKKYKERD